MKTAIVRILTGIRFVLIIIKPYIIPIYSASYSDSFVCFETNIDKKWTNVNKHKLSTTRHYK